jgi:hypothetical protein
MRNLLGTDPIAERSVSGVVIGDGSRATTHQNVPSSMLLVIGEVGRLLDFSIHPHRN